jgi:toxin ParE1/3/4
MASYRLSAEAAEDLGRLYEWGIRNFGLLEADRYYDGLLVTLETIGRTPEAFPAVDHIKPGYRRGVYKATSIYFIVPEGTVHIVRILGRQNPGDAL